MEEQWRREQEEQQARAAAVEAKAVKASLAISQREEAREQELLLALSQQGQAAHTEAEVRANAPAAEQTATPPSAVGSTVVSSLLRAFELSEQVVSKFHHEAFVPSSLVVLREVRDSEPGWGDAHSC